MRACCTPERPTVHHTEAQATLAAAAQGTLTAAARRPRRRHRWQSRFNTLAYHPRAAVVYKHQASSDRPVRLCRLSALAGWLVFVYVLAVSSVSRVVICIALCRSSRETLPALHSGGFFFLVHHRGVAYSSLGLLQIWLNTRIAIDDGDSAGC